MTTLTSLTPEASKTVDDILTDKVIKVVRNVGVVDSVRSELEYQARRWNDVTTVTKGEHSPLAFLTFIDSYLSEARDLISRNAEQDVIEEVASIFRKISAMGLVTTHQNNHNFEHGTTPDYTFSELTAVCRCILNKAYDSITYRGNDKGTSYITLNYIEDMTVLILRSMENHNLAPMRILEEA